MTLTEHRRACAEINRLQRLKRRISEAKGRQQATRDLQDSGMSPVDVIKAALSKLGLDAEVVQLSGEAPHATTTGSKH